MSPGPAALTVDQPGGCRRIADTARQGVEPTSLEVNLAAGEWTYVPDTPITRSFVTGVAGLSTRPGAPARDARTRRARPSAACVRAIILPCGAHSLTCYPLIRNIYGVR